MWQTSGLTQNIHSPIIAIYRNKIPLWKMFSKKFIGNIDNNNNKMLLAGLSSASSIPHKSKLPSVYNIPKDRLLDIQDGDIIKITPNGFIQKIWDINSDQNVLYLTDKCNSNCIMCPQKISDCRDYKDDVEKLLSLLKESDLNIVCITGGEPTLDPAYFISIAQKLNSKAPKSLCLVLTNGRQLQKFSFAKNAVLSLPTNTVFAIPIYSPIPDCHNSIVGVKNAFTETILGIHNLIRLNSQFEIRVVLMKNNYKQLNEISNYIGWNLPMTRHVAFMAMEVHGSAAEKSQEVWVEPKEYIEYLEPAIYNLSNRNIPVSIYNLPLCLLPKKLWKYSRQSISEWKCTYTSECEICIKRNDCSGFFSTSTFCPSGIKTILED